ncbi:glycosyltransferase [Gordonia namibiensis]|nr:glycosyltransferase [Gordonia namibiensis]
MREQQNNELKIVVAILTYNRNEGLRDSARSVLDDIISSDNSGIIATVLIVDNNPTPQDFSDLIEGFQIEVSYVHVAEPGIAAGRNAAVEFAETNAYNLLVFIDDDEVVAPGWSNALVATALEYGADAVFGPVEPEFSEDCPKWAKRFGFFERPHGVTGGPVRWPATNNVALRTDGALRGIRFDDRWSSTGGSDSRFFHDGLSKGASYVWCEDAVVHERIGVQRANMRWLWRRGVRLGNVSARLNPRQLKAPVLVGAAIVRLAVALPVAAVYGVASPRRVGPTVMNIPKGVGMIRYLSGRLENEYAR